MPSRAKRACKQPNCSELVDNGYCNNHKQHTNDYDRWRGQSQTRGYDNDWRRIRLIALRRDRYLCQHCLRDGLVTPAIDVDHIIPISVDPTRRLDIDNLQSLCRPCHNIKTAIESR
ncbi:MAG: HNH endonuclease [Acidobacteriaceae bacterium]|nr:HNH endonuclease [Acidobacteriaceae bacterium]